MKLISTKYTLNRNVFLCRGAKFSVILDCGNRRTYHLDSEVTEALNKIIDSDGRTELTDSEEKVFDLLLGKDLISESVTGNVTEKPRIPRDYIETVWLELRKKCNLSCIHCYNNSNPSFDDRRDMLSLDEWKSVADMLSEISVKTIVLIGGEPLLYPDVCSLIEYIRKVMPKVNICLYSNLTLVNDEIAAVIKNNNVAVVTSIYANTDSVHDSITQNRGSFARTGNSVKKLLEAGVSVKANTVLMARNEQVIGDTFRFIRELTGKKCKCDEIRCTDDKLSDLVPSKSLNDHIKHSPNSLMKPSLKILMHNMAGNSCWQGKINISYNGFVGPCIMWQSKIDDNYSVRHNCLSDIMKKRIIPEYWEFSRDKIDVCRKCEYRYICSDCRPVAVSMKSRGLTCCYNPYTGRWYENIEPLRRYLSAQKAECHHGKTNVAFVLPSPGYDEKTQNNLQNLICLLHKSRPEIFTSDRANDYRITYSSDVIRTENSVPDAEIRIPENIARLENDLDGCKYAVFMGEKAQLASSLADLHCCRINCCHIGSQGLGRTYSVDNDTSSERNLQRIGRLADDIIKNLGD